MNWLDIVIIVVIGVSAFLGLKAGLIKAVLVLAGLIVGVFLAGRYYVPLSEKLAFIPQDNAAKIVAFLIILVVVMIIARLLASLLGKLASIVMLGWINRIGGAIFGLVLGAFLCGALLAIWIKYFGVAGVILDSRLALILLDRLPAVLALLPKEFEAIRSFFQ